MSRANGASFVFASCFVAARSRWIQARRHDMKSSSLSVELLVLSMALLRSGALSHTRKISTYIVVYCLQLPIPTYSVVCGLTQLSQRTLSLELLIVPLIYMMIPALVGIMEQYPSNKCVPYHYGRQISSSSTATPHYASYGKCHG